jgi:hypothetical protein
MPMLTELCAIHNSSELQKKGFETKYHKGWALMATLRLSLMEINGESIEKCSTKNSTSQWFTNTKRNSSDMHCLCFLDGVIFREASVFTLAD